MITSYKISTDGSIRGYGESGIEKITLYSSEVKNFLEAIQPFVTNRATYNGYCIRIDPDTYSAAVVEIGCQRIKLSLLQKFYKEYQEEEWKKPQKTEIKPGDILAVTSGIAEWEVCIANSPKELYLKVCKGPNTGKLFGPYSMPAGKPWTLEDLIDTNGVLSNVCKKGESE